jgi:hypothetical protein
MRLNRLPGVTSNPDPAGGHRASAGVVRALSVTAAAVAVSAMGALPAMASTAHATKYATTTVVSVPKTGYTHTNITLSATEKGRGGNPTGTVTFWSGTRKLCHGSLKARKTSCTTQFVDPATKTLIAKYSGNAHHKAPTTRRRRARPRSRSRTSRQPAAAARSPRPPRSPPQRPTCIPM